MSQSHITINFSNQAFDLDVEFPLPPRGITGLYGPSGSGKSTLIRCLAGLERRTVAQIQIGDKVWQSATEFLPPHKRRVGLVFQDVRLFGHLNVQNNLLFGHKRIPPAERKINMADVVDILDLAPLLDRHTENLSGGETQRVAIGRALLASPSLLLMDEPLAALGEQHKKDILPYLKKLPEIFAIPLLYVCHDFAEMASLAQYIICLKEGKIECMGDILAVASAMPEVMNRWAPDNIITGEVCDSGSFKLADGQTIPVAPETSPTRLIINARDISLLRNSPEHHAGEAVLKGKIENISGICGGKNIITISLCGQKILVITGKGTGEKTWISPGNDVCMMVNRIKSDPEYA